MRVAIVGAGASGLQCAHSLLSSKIISPEQLVIVEARERIGGRVHTHNGYDLGAAWVHGTGRDWNGDTTTPTTVSTTSTISSSTSQPNIHHHHHFHHPQNPMMTLLQQTTPSDKTVDQYHLRYVCHGNPWMRPQSVLHQTQQLQLYQSGICMDPMDPTIPAALQEHYSRLEHVAQYGATLYAQGRGLDTAHISLQDALQQQNGPVKHNLTLFYQHLLECWYGAAASELQLCEFADDYVHEETKEQKEEDDDHHHPSINTSSHQDKDPIPIHLTDWDSEYTPEGDFYGPHCTLQRGMISVLEPLLLDGVEERIRLGEPIVRMSLTENDTVLLETKQGNLIEADCCVVTMPAGCLREALHQGTFFASPLSPAKQEAIEYLQMGTYKKVLLTFDHIFWPTEPAFLGMIRAEGTDNTLGPCLLIDNLWASQGKPCLEAVLFGHDGTWATGQPDTVIRDAVLDFMEHAMGKPHLHSHCTDCHITRWEEDPYSRGAYSSMKLGCMLRHVEELRQPEWNGRLILSGEATITEFEGSVHAALMSGRNAKEAVVQLFERDQQKGVAEQVIMSKTTMTTDQQPQQHQQPPSDTASVLSIA